MGEGGSPRGRKSAVLFDEWTFVTEYSQVVRNN
jgi:hypothetical protein